MMNNMNFPNGLNENILPKNKESEQMKNLFPQYLKKYNVIFNLPCGITFCFIVYYYESMFELISSFCKKIGDSYEFLEYFYNEEKINYLYEQVDSFFKNEQNPIIYIKDLNNSLKLIKIRFIDNHRNKVGMVINQNKNMKFLLEEYYSKIDLDDLNKEGIEFFLNKKKIEFNSENTIGKYFNIDYNKDINNISIIVNDKNNIIQIKNITFKDNHGDIRVITINKDRAINYLIEKYLIKIKHSELIERGGELKFTYKNNNIDINEKTSVNNYFKNDQNPIIDVYDANEILLINPFIKYEVTFETTNGRIILLYSFIGNTMKRILNNFLNFVGCPNLINKKNKINFVYNAEKIDEKCSVLKYFKKEMNPKIVVLDPNNLLIDNSKEKMNIIFKTISGRILTLIVNNDITLERLLTLFYLKSDLTSKNINKLVFTHNLKHLKLGDQTQVQKFFINNPVIEVNEINI